jgi:MFS family permease
MLTIVLPGVSTTIVKRFHSSPKARDKRLTQLSCLLLSTGSFTVFTAGNPSLVVFGIILAASGSFFNATARGFVTALVSPNHLGAVYTGITVATYGGMLASGPLLAQVFHWGMKVGGLWTGLPFLVASGLFLVCLAAVSVIDL